MSIKLDFTHTHKNTSYTVNALSNTLILLNVFFCLGGILSKDVLTFHSAIQGQTIHPIEKFFTLSLLKFL